MNKDIYFNSTIMTVEELKAFTHHVERLEELDTKRVHLNRWTDDNHEFEEMYDPDNKTWTVTVKTR